MTKVVNWYRLYSEGWGDDIVPDAYSHPAKYARGLIRQIYRYALERGFVQAGDHIVDPFGGVALGSLDAMLSGLHWTGCELEEKFVALGNANLDLWRGRYAPHFTGWGTARLVQGDSRQLCRVIGDAAAVVSSPPYAAVFRGQSDNATRQEREERAGVKLGGGQINHSRDYGSSSGQLANLPEGNYSAVITSPPFGEGETRNRSTFQDGEVASMMSRAYTQDKQGTSAGNLAILKADDTGYAAAVSSPPYADQLNNWNEGAGVRWDAERHPGNPNKRSGDTAYGVTDGNLGHMSACVSSPPYENAVNANGEGPGMAGNAAQRRRIYSNSQTERAAQSREIGYGDHPSNIGNDQGETFWSAAALIVGQVYQVLKPGGYTFWVCKDFVRNKKRVPFSDQWQALCEAHGFVPVERVRAWVVEDHGTQGNMFGDDKLLRKERKSFFRRLAEKNGSPRIDWEDVIIMRKPIG